jgi:hypothetical protein
LFAQWVGWWCMLTNDGQKAGMVHRNWRVPLKRAVAGF